MDDELTLCVRNGIEHVQKQRETLRQRQSMGPAVLVDRLALDVLENQVGLPVLAHAGIEEPSDVGVGEPSQQVRLDAGLG